MLEIINATCIRHSDERVLLDVGPFTLSGRCSLRDGVALVELGTGEIRTELEWDEAGPRLYVFIDQSRQLLYRALRQVAGIGPSTALKILDAGEAIDVLRAAAAREVSFFTQVPGVGAKRAQQVIDQIQRASAGALPVAVPVPVADWVEIRERLASGDISIHEVEMALVSVAHECDGDPCRLEALAREEIR